MLSKYPSWLTCSRICSVYHSPAVSTISRLNTAMATVAPICRTISATMTAMYPMSRMVATQRATLLLPRHVKRAPNIPSHDRRTRNTPAMIPRMRGDSIPAVNSPNPFMVPRRTPQATTSSTPMQRPRRFKRTNKMAKNTRQHTQLPIPTASSVVSELISKCRTKEAPGYAKP